MSLSSALQKTKEATSWSGTLLTQQRTQLIWASYGYSYFVDKSESDLNPVKRHRTVPSAHGYYPLRIYVVTESGVYRFIPNFYDPINGLLRGVWILPVMALLSKVTSGDRRGEVALSSESFVTHAPLIIIPVLNVKDTVHWDDFSDEAHRWLWYYEAGAAAQNVLLEGAAWNLSGTIVSPTDVSSLRSLLKLNESFVPLLVIPIGK